jgi:hypothetical protein
MMFPYSSWSDFSYSLNHPFHNTQSLEVSRFRNALSCYSSLTTLDQLFTDESVEPVVWGNAVNLSEVLII